MTVLRIAVPHIAALRHTLIDALKFAGQVTATVAYYWHTLLHRFVACPQEVCAPALWHSTTTRSGCRVVAGPVLA